MSSLHHEVREYGLCPNCSTPVEYKYVLNGPEGSGLRVQYHVSCEICGFSESKILIFPIDALFYIRMLFEPSTRIFIEKVRIASEIKVQVVSSGDTGREE
ncbi:MAG: hypothetical protein QXN05_05350 [Acidilobaceae archaeon]